MACTLVQYARMLPSSASLLSYYASFSTSMMLLRNACKELVPEKLEEYVLEKLSSFFSRKAPPSQSTFIIDDYWDCFDRNELIKAVTLYLSSKIGPNNKTVKVGKFRKQEDLTTGLVRGEEIVDKFDGIEVTWKLLNENDNENSGRQKRYVSDANSYFELTFEEKDRDIVLKKYLTRILQIHEANKNQGQRVLQLFTKKNYRGSWTSLDFDHPSTFDTLAMDYDLKKAIMDDLDKFLSRKDFYRRVGKAWKRGYLLYGPPGTGKSSLIAAIANYLKYDIYNLELGSVTSDTDLRDTLLDTGNKSLIVVEDIDCNQEVWNRDLSDDDDEYYDDDENDDNSPGNSNYDSKFTLSTLLNCMDGLWSVCGDERIFVFTTNHKELLDPALLRPGRMDMHIHMSYCTTQGFRVLVSNYLEIQEHPLFEEIDDLIRTLEVTPAALAEELMKSELPDVALEGVLSYLKKKKMEKDTKRKFGREGARQEKKMEKAAEKAG
ncbi:hypothetical protein K2173_021294 [Erythroxylum novogranatense]|uniref:AAA+ ATPase domain-containing protein n=1 Tax=Erythroxylum novogranatense TaxID=1862640 RepID=A0AAV8TUF5_9ROSI|nr:hypothetical protein K2173_021294 [Erythroxylum novogranatense]